MRPFPSASIAVASSILLALPCLAASQAAQRVPVLATPHFAIFSELETNLNDALIAAGLARKKGQTELFRSGDEVACFTALVPSERAAWDGAVDYYAKIISPVDFGARQQFLLRLELVGFAPDGNNAADAEFIRIARGFRALAAPAYQACRWAAQDAENRRWIDDMKPRLAAHEEEIASRLERLYQNRWKTLPILVDVVETVDWSGANTSWSEEGQGDVLISRTVPGPAGFETLFHESSHVLMDRAAPLPTALGEAAKAAGITLPRDLWHVVLFYTTGEVMRGVLDAGGDTRYSPMLYDIFKRGSWTEYKESLETSWLPYVQGKASLADASASLISSVRAAAKPRTK